MARRRRGPGSASGAAAAAAAVAPADAGPSAAPGVHATATALADLPAEVLLEVAVRLPTTQDVHAFVSRTSKALRQQVSGAAAAASTLPARWLLRHRPATALACAARHGDMEVLEAVLALAAGQPDPQDLKQALEAAAKEEEKGPRMVQALVAAGGDPWAFMARLIGQCFSLSLTIRRDDRGVGVLLRAVGAAEAPPQAEGAGPRWTLPDGGEALRQALHVGGGGAGEGAGRLDEMLTDAVECGRAWIVRALLAAGADVDRAIDEQTVYELCEELYDYSDSRYRLAAEALAGTGTAVGLHVALALAAHHGTADEVRRLLSGPLGGGRGGDDWGGRVGAVGRALKLAPRNPSAPAVVRLLLEDAAGGQAQGQSQVHQFWLDEALRVAVYWGAKMQPGALAEVLGLLAGAGATAGDFEGEELRDLDDGVVVALALALRAAGAGDEGIDWEALRRVVRTEDAGQLRALVAAGVGGSGTA